MSPTDYGSVNKAIHDGSVRKATDYGYIKKTIDYGYVNKYYVKKTTDDESVKKTIDYGSVNKAIDNGSANQAIDYSCKEIKKDNQVSDVNKDVKASVLNTDIDASTARCEPVDLCTRDTCQRSPDDKRSSYDRSRAKRSVIVDNGVSGGWVMAGQTAVPYVWRQGQQHLSASVLRHGVGLKHLVPKYLLLSSTRTESECINRLCQNAGIKFTFKPDTDLISLRGLTNRYPHLTPMIQAVSTEDSIHV